MPRKPSPRATPPRSIWLDAEIDAVLVRLGEVSPKRAAKTDRQAAKLVARVKELGGGVSGLDAAMDEIDERRRAKLARKPVAVEPARDFERRATTTASTPREAAERPPAPAAESPAAPTPKPKRRPRPLGSIGYRLPNGGGFLDSRLYDD